MKLKKLQAKTMKMKVSFDAKTNLPRPRNLFEKVVNINQYLLHQ